MDLNKWPALRNHIEVGDDKQLYNGQSKAGESVLTVFRISKSKTQFSYAVSRLFLFLVLFSAPNLRIYSE